mmetsp:Transcript_15946/g.31843  ORF Transcript_15946/g.31843 Transcript_15946/m.31843 type:complete len:172 (-) Transcript_15946:415-930(-)
MMLMLTILEFLIIAPIASSFKGLPVMPLAMNKPRGRVGLRVTNEEGSPVEIRSLSPEEGRASGLLEWPSIEKSSDFVDRCEVGEQFYVLEGTADVSISLFLNGLELENQTLQPGDLLTVNEPCALSWKLTGSSERKLLVLLTPTYTESKLFLGVAAAAIISFGLLLATSGG